jgi:hypothetical protein
VAVSGRTDEDGRARRRGWKVRADRAVPLGLTAAMAVVVMAGLAGCNTNPHSPDLSAPAQAIQPAAGTSSPHMPGKHPKPGIQLPNTLTLAYDHTPTFADAAHHVVLWNANQAVKAELAAAYEKTSAATPDLKRYWTGAAYTQAHAWSQSWIDAKKRPVGRVVVSNVTVESLTNVQASISYCQDMSQVIRGDELTHTGGKPVQDPHTDGQHVQLTMVPTGTKSQWQVSSETVTLNSPLCPPLGAPTHKGKHS